MCFKSASQRELESRGWRFRDGWWICPECSAAVDDPYAHGLWHDRLVADIRQALWH